MPDNTLLNGVSVDGGDNYASKDVAGVKSQRVLLQYGEGAGVQDVEAATPMPVRTASTSAFGDEVRVNPVPQIQLAFPYGSDTDKIIKFSGGSGSISDQDGQVVLNTGVTTLSDAAFSSKDILEYQPGFGAACRFTWGVSTAGDLSGTFQQAGVGTQEDGYFFSYQNNDMAIILRRGGKRHHHVFEITAGSTSATDVSVELDGTTYTVAVSDNVGDANATAAEIAADNQFLLQGGTTTWLAYAEGNQITFISERTGPKSGAFSFSPGTSGATAALSLKVTGVAETSKVIARTAWNADPADGSKKLPIIDWSKGNVFMIQYQWLGYGIQSFWLEDPASGNYVLLHKESYANANTVPSVRNPALAFTANVANALTTKNLTAFVSSVGGFSSGGTGKTGVPHAATFSASVGTSLEPIVSFRAPRYFKGFPNLSPSRLLRIALTGSAAANIVIIKNGLLAGATSWQETANFLLQTDVVATGVTGDIVWADRVEQKGRILIEPQSSGLEEIVRIYPGDVVTIAAVADTGSSSIFIAANWLETVY